MVKNILKYIAAAVMIAVLPLSCAKEEIDPGASTLDTDVDVTLAAASQGTKTVFNGTDAANWSVGDSIGVTCKVGAEYTNSILRKFTHSSASAARSVSFSGKLVEKGAATYTIYAVYPYQESKYADNLTYTLPNIQHPTATSWDPDCDIMVGKTTAQTATASVTEATGAISFKHMMGWLKLSFSGFGSDIMDEHVHYIRVASHSGGAPIAGDFTINLEDQSIVATEARDQFIIADFHDENNAANHIALKDLTAYITMLPGTYGKIMISVKTDSHYILCGERTNLTIEAGKISPASVTLKAADKTNADMSELIGTMPTKSSKTDALNVLALGHAWTEDAMHYLPNLCSAAGLENVNLHYFFYADCSLDQYWEFIKTDTAPSYYYSYDSTNGWTAQTGVKISDVLEGTAWDVVIFEHKAPGHWVKDNFIGAADYSTYRPYLNFLLEYVHSTVHTRQGTYPFLVWNMFRSYNSLHQVDCDDDYTNMYNAVLAATNSMQSEFHFPLILTPATAFQTARTGTFSDTKYQLLLRDGVHASYGLGRYLEACVWFQQLIVPIYTSAGVTSVVGNTFLPSATEKSFADDEVTSAHASTLQSIASSTSPITWPATP